MSFFNRLTAVVLATALAAPIVPLDASTRKGNKDLAQGRAFEEKKDWDNSAAQYQKYLELAADGRERAIAKSLLDQVEKNRNSEKEKKP